MVEFNTENVDGTEYDSRNNHKNSSNFVFKTLLDVKEEVHNSEDENCFEVKEEPLFVDDSEANCTKSHTRMLTAKEESQELQEEPVETFKLESCQPLDSIIEFLPILMKDCEENSPHEPPDTSHAMNDGASDENDFEGFLPSEIHRPTLLKLREKYSAFENSHRKQSIITQGENLEDVESEMEFSFLDDCTTSSLDAVQRNPVLHPCRVILEDCMKGLLENKKNAQFIPRLNSSVAKRSTNSKKKLYQCEDCGEGFSWLGNCIRHLKIHTGEKVYFCKDCNQSFSRSDTLIEHQRTHTGEKPFLCKDCGKRFSQKFHLIRHQRTHKEPEQKTEDKPFFCKDCGKKYSTNSSLKEHQRKHTGEKPYLCKDCGKRFSSRTSYTRHIRIHTGEKPFCCENCGKKFSRRYFLTRHARLHSGEKP